MGQRYINEFTFGFELEAWGETLNDKELFLKYAYDYFRKNLKLGHQMDLSTMSHGGDGSIKPDSNNNICNSCGGSGRIVCQNCGGNGSVNTRCRRCNGDSSCIICDGTGQVEATCGECDGDGDWHCDDCDGTGGDGNRRDTRAFEFKSPIMNINNGNISKTIRFLCEGMTKFNIKTNKSCGFHIHMGFPEKSLTHIDRLWVLLNLIDNTEMLKQISTFNNIHLFDGEYANFDLIKNISRIINNNSEGFNLNDKLVEMGISSDKYVVLRQHPQGTLEWRGPRGFMDEGNPEDVKNFFLNCFLPFAKWIKDILSKNEVIVFSKTIKKDLLIQQSIQYNNKYKNRVVPEFFIKEKATDHRFSPSFNKKLISELFSNYSWALKQNRLDGIHDVLISDDSITFCGGTIESKNLLNSKQKLPLSFSNIKAFGNYDVKRARSTQFLNGSIICEKSSNCTYSEVSSAKVQDSCNDTFIRSHIYSGKYKSDEIKKSRISDGVFDKCRIYGGITLGGEFRDSNFSDQPKIQGGILRHCEVKLYTTSFEKTRTRFINCSFYVRNDVIFKGICVSPAVFLTNINVYLRKMFADKKIINAKFKDTKEYTTSELIAYLNTMINNYL